jgi:hypothetical protein
MKIMVKPSFGKDVDRTRSRELLIALDEKLDQILKAKTADQITGLKLLRGYSHHFRIYVKTEKLSYRIGAIIRGDMVWLIRFLPRRVIYKKYP